MALGKNIEHLRTQAGLGRPDLARRIDPDNAVQLAQAIYALETRDSVRSEYATALAEVFQVSLRALLDENMTDLSLDEIRSRWPVPQFEGQGSNRAAAVAPSASGKQPLPVISMAQAGRMKDLSEPYPPGAGLDIVYADTDLSRWAFALEIEGDAMLPEFKQGDRVIIEPEWSPRPGEFVVAKNSRNEATFKKYRPRGTAEDGSQIFELVPLNEDYPTLRSDRESLEIIGVMAEHRKRSRRPKF
jgi:SOS-response transcriptional repressor LexA